jgi:acylphosphatase
METNLNVSVQSNPSSVLMTNKNLEEVRISIIVKGTSEQIEMLKSSIHELGMKGGFERICFGSWPLSERDLEVP